MARTLRQAVADLGYEIRQMDKLIERSFLGRRPTPPALFLPGGADPQPPRPSLSEGAGATEGQ